MIKPKFTFEKIKFSVNPPTFKKAIELYEKNKIKNFQETQYSYTAKVQGTSTYNVSIETNRHDYGYCDCYIGQKGDLCKHMVAVAIYAIFRGKKIPEKNKKIILNPVCSNRKGELDEIELKKVKEKISEANRLVRSYNGPSSTWFTYQNKLDEAVGRLTEVVSKIPVSYQTSNILVSLIMKLDKKLVNGGVDDSNGTVGGFIQNVVDILEEFAELDKECLKSFKKLKGIDTCFGWEDDLLKLISEEK